MQQLTFQWFYCTKQERDKVSLEPTILVMCRAVGPGVWGGNYPHPSFFFVKLKEYTRLKSGVLKWTHRSFHFRIIWYPKFLCKIGFWMLKVTKSWKQIKASLILPKNEQNTLIKVSWMRFVHFLEESTKS